jgi:putative peptidoglycan lipid II flippase
LYFSLGLFSFGGIKILVTAFYALQDTKTPVMVAGGCLLVNTILNFIFMVPFKISGIALASSIAGTIDFLVLFYLLERRLGGLNFGLLSYFLKVSLAGLSMGIAVYCLWNYVVSPNEVAKLCLITCVSCLIYGGMCLILRIEQAQKILAWIWIYKRKYTALQKSVIF